MSDEQITDPTPNYSRLRLTNLRWAKFAEAYAMGCNKSEAVRRAGYSYSGVNANSMYAQQGTKLINQPLVRVAVEELLSHAAMGKQEVLARLTAQASFDPSQLITVDEAGKVGLDWKVAKEIGLLRYVRSIEVTARRVKVDWLDQQKALELLGKHHRLFSDVLTMGDKPDQTARELSDEDLATIILNEERRTADDQLADDLDEASGADAAL